LTLGHFFLSLALRRNHALTSIPITVSRDNGPSTHQKYLVLLVTTLERLFLGLHPYWGMEPKPLHFTAVGAYPQHFLRTVPSLLFGRRPKYGTSAHGYFSHNVQEIQLNFESGFNMDGELSTPDPKLGPVRLSDGGVISFIRF
jgi:hypothetical protein